MPHITQCMWRIHTCMLRGHFWPRRLLLLTGAASSLFRGGYRDHSASARRIRTSRCYGAGTTRSRCEYVTSRCRVCDSSPHRRLRSSSYLKNSGDNSLPNSDDELSAPVVVASHSSNIVDVLSDLLDEGPDRARRHSPRRVKRCSHFLDAPAVS